MGVEMMQKSGCGKFIVVVIACLALAIVAAPAGAALLAPGGLQFPSPGEPDPTGGAVVGGPLVMPFNVPGFFNGTLTSTVIQGDPSNTLGGLTFTYQLMNATFSPNAIARMTVHDFTGFLTDTSFQTPAAGNRPAFIDRVTADVIGFAFAAIGATGDGALMPGQTSALLVVQTDATAFTQSTASIIDSGAIAVPILAPVPEPATLGLAAFGALALIRRRR